MTPNKMICPECESQGLKSILRRDDAFFQSAIYRLEYYWDEDGNYHNHDDAPNICFWYCSNGHKLKSVYYRPCPECGYIAGETKDLHLVSDTLNKR